MRNIPVVLTLIILLLAGCSNTDLSKQEYYDKGLIFLENDSPRGAKLAFKKAIEKDPNYFEARYQLALSYLKLGNYEKAEKELLKVLRLNPSYSEAHLSLGAIHVKRGDLDKALEEVDIFFSSDDSNPEAYELAATIHAAKKDYAKAEEILIKSIEMFPDRTLSKLGLADVYLLNAKIDKSEELIKEVLEDEDRNTKALYLYARIKQKQGMVDDMIAAYEKLIEIDPGHIAAHMELGFAYLSLDKFEDAKKIAEKLKKDHEKRPEGSYLMGLVYFQEKKIDEAMVQLQKAVRKSVIPGAYYYLGLCYLSKGNLEQATSEFQRVLNSRPEMVQARLLLAVVHLRKGRGEEAEKEALRVLETEDENAFAHNLLGSAYLAQGKGDLAMREFDRAIELNPEFVDAHLKKGAFSLLSGDVDEAEREFVDAVEIAPEILNTRIILAQYYIKDKRYDDAIKTLKEGLKESPEDATLHNIIAVAYLGSEDQEQAVFYFKKSIEFDPMFFSPYFNLASIYLKNGDKEKAIKEYNKVLELDSNNDSALLMLARIAEGERKDKEALAYYERARLTGTPIAYLSLAGYYQRRKDSTRAIEVIDEALQHHPEDVNISDMKGRIYVANKNYREALLVYSQLKDISLETGLERMAGVYMAMGEYDKAINELTGLQVKRPESMGVIGRIVNIQLMKKDFREAEKSAREIISLSPESDKGYQVLAKVYLADNRIEKSISALEKAEELSPGNLEITIAKGRVYLTAGEYKKAMDVFKGIEKSNSEYAPAYFFQATVLELEGRKEAAVERHKKALEYSPDYVPSLNNLAYLYTEGYGPLEKAVEMAQKAKKSAPRDGRVSDTLGWAYYKTGNYDEALKNFKEAVYYLPDEAAIHYHFGLAYMKKNMNDRAEKEFNDAIRLGYQTSFPELKDAQAALERVKKR